MKNRDNTIQFDSSVPRYKQLEGIILDKIERMSEGDMLPPEREWQQLYDVSRATVRAALDEIERLGWIKRIQGVGTVITKPKIKPEKMKLTSFSEDILARGMKPGSKNLELALVLPPKPASEALRLRTGTKVLFVKRLRLADEEPVGIHELYIPPALEFSPNDLSTMSSYYVLLREHHNLEPTHAIERLTARNASEEEAQVLGTEIGDALLAIERTTYTDNEVPLEFVSLVYRADRYEYQVALYRERE